MSLAAKGAGKTIYLLNGSGTGLQVYATGNANYLRTTGVATTNAPILSAQGSDTNIDIALTPKGTGVVQFGAYTAGVLTPTGYITIKDSGGTVRRLLVG